MQSKRSSVAKLMMLTEVKKCNEAIGTRGRFATAAELLVFTSATVFREPLVLGKVLAAGPLAINNQHSDCVAMLLKLNHGNAAELQQS